MAKLSGPWLLLKMPHQRAWRWVLAVVSLLSVALPSFAQDAAKEPTFSPGYKFAETSGEALFANICQGCHMPDARGAAGAGAYPSLQDDKNLQTPGYPLTIVLNGQRAMPPFGAMMSDEQVAAVVNYLRTHFGNDYQDAVTAADVKTVRP
jgi:mono/diheme cytochrome c family protein